MPRSEKRETLNGLVALAVVLVTVTSVQAVGIGFTGMSAGTVAASILADTTSDLAPLACGDADAGSCCAPGGNGTPYCSNAACCEAVCAIDAYCCEGEWDGICAQEAADFPECGICDICGVPGAGSCFEDNGTPGCEDAACCEAVCLSDPACCDTSWDGVCAEAAASEPACAGERPRITGWRSMRTHAGRGPLPIAINPAAVSDAVTSESRLGGVREIRVGFSGPVSLGGDAIQVENLTDGSSIPADGQMLINGDQTLVLSFDAGTLPDQKCYRIDLAGQIPDLVGDTDCRFVALEGDCDGNGDVAIADAQLAFDRNADPVIAETARFDIDLNGNMELADALLAFDRNANAASCP